MKKKKSKKIADQEMEKIRKEERRADIQRMILGIVGIAGLMSLALVAPNAIQMLQLFNKKNSFRYRSAHYINGIVGKLQKKDWVWIEKRGGQSFLRLTQKGEWELLKYKLREKTLEKKKWDGKWRLVIFDVKEFKRGVRDIIRENIVSFGFVRLQNSVWVYPHDCEDVIVLLKAHCRIGKEVLYLIVEKIENDTWLKEKFSLV